MNKEELHKAYLGKIETKDEALKVIKDSSNGFLVLAALQVIAGLLIGVGAIIDGIIYATLALLLRKFNSRVVAVILFLLSLLAVFFTVYNRLGNGEGGRNIILAIIMTWVSFRSVQATFAYEKFSKTQSDENSLEQKLT